MSEYKKSHVYEKIAKYSIFVGFAISFIMLIIFLLKGSYSFNINNNISEEKIGQFGDFIGGIIGTLFSLVGVILFYLALKEQREDFKTNKKALESQLEAFNQQIKEFELQREELISSRYEYTHNRITNLVYIQLSKFEKAIENLKIKESNTSGEPLKGYSAIYFLNKKLNYIYLSSDQKNVMIKEATNQKLKIEENLGIIFKSSAELAEFVLSAFNYASTFNSIVDKSRIEVQDKDELREIFTGNTGIELIELLNKLDYTLHFISTFPDELDPFNNFNSDLKAMNFYLGELTNFLDY